MLANACECLWAGRPAGLLAGWPAGWLAGLPASWPVAGGLLGRGWWAAGLLGCEPLLGEVGSLRLELRAQVAP